MDWDQREHLRKILTPGVGLVMDPRYPEPFIIRIPLLALNKNVSDDDVLDRLSKSVDGLYAAGDAVQVKEAIRISRGLKADAAGLLTARPSGKTVGGSQSGSPPASGTRDRKPKSRGASSEGTQDSQTLHLLRLWLMGETSFRTLASLLKEAGITSGSAKKSMTEDLVRKDFARLHKLQRGKTRLLIPEPTDRAFGCLGLEKPSWPSKGGFVHQWLAHHYRVYGFRRGYRVAVEYFLENGKAVDVVMWTEDQVIFIEIVMSEPLEKELQNAIKDMSSPLVPNRIVFACRDGKMRRALSALITSDPRVVAFRDKLEVVVALDYLSELGGQR